MYLTIKGQFFEKRYPDKNFLSKDFNDLSRLYVFEISCKSDETFCVNDSIILILQAFPMWLTEMGKDIDVKHSEHTHVLVRREFIL